MRNIPMPLKAMALPSIAALLCTSSLAQSTVTLYGRINTSVENQRIGIADRVSVLNDNASRFGLRAREDLGNGLFAMAQLESGFDSSTGANTASAFFNRRSHVEAGSAVWGSVRMGAWLPGSYFALADYVSLHNHDTGRSADALYSFVAFTKANKIAYLGPQWHGLRSELSVAMAEGNGKNTVDASAQYDAGPWHLGAAYARQGPGQQMGLRALYEWSQWTLGGYVQRESVDGSVNGKSRGIFRLAAMYRIGPSEFHLNGGYTQKGGAQSERARQYTLAYNYNLSLRTKVYTYYTAVDSDTKAKSSNSIALGVRHNF